MTKFEFEQCTQISVTERDFEIINAAYMMSDLDKDAFCKEWRVSNKQFIAYRKQVMANESAKSELKKAVIALYWQIIADYNEWHEAYLTDDDLDTLKKAKINPNSATILTEIDNFLNQTDKYQRL